MKNWSYLVQVSIDKLITCQNQCVQHVIWFGEVWYIVCYSPLNNLGINNMDAVPIKESKYSETGCLITV